MVGLFATVFAVLWLDLANSLKEIDDSLVRAYFKDMLTMKAFGDNHPFVLELHAACNMTISSFSSEPRILSAIHDMGSHANNPCTTCGYLVLTDALPLDLTTYAAINTNGRWLFVTLDTDAALVENFLRLAWTKIHVLNIAVFSDNQLIFYDPFARGGDGQRGAIFFRNASSEQHDWNRRLVNLQGGELNITFLAAPSKYLPAKRYYSATNPLEKHDYIRGALMDYMFAGIHATAVEISGQYPGIGNGIKLPNGTMTGVLKLIDENLVEMSGNTRLLLDLGASNVAYVWHQLDNMKFIVPVRPPALTTIRSAFELLDSTSQWLTLLVVVLLIVVWYLSTSISLGQVILNMLSTLHNVSISDVSRTHTSRVVFAMALFYTLIVTNTYQGSIVSRLSSAPPSTNIQTVDQLLATDLPIVAIVLSADLRSSFDDRLAKRVKIEQKFTSVDELLASKRMAILLRTSFAETLRATQFDQHTGKDKIHVVPESPISFLDSFIVRRNSPFLASYERLIQQAIESGFYDYGLRRTQLAQHLEYQTRYKTILSKDRIDAVPPMTVGNLRPAFMFWLTGLVGSTVVVVVELIWDWCQRKRLKSTLKTTKNKQQVSHQHEIQHM